MRTGSCLCGAVSFSAEIGNGIQACHCTQCQRWTGGGPLFSVRAKNVTITGGDRVSAYCASDYGERIVCGTCGSTLWWKMQGKPNSYVAAGLLDDQTGLSVTEEIFVDYRPAWMSPFDGATQSTEAQELEKLDAYLAQQKG